jgi:hypothetical protein
MHRTGKRKLMDPTDELLILFERFVATITPSVAGV